MRLVEHADGPTVAVVTRAGNADVQEGGGKQLARGRLVHPVIGFRIDIVAADPDQVAAAGHVSLQPGGRVRVGCREVDAENGCIVAQRFADQFVGGQNCGSHRPTARCCWSQGLLDVERVLQVRDLMPAGLDHGHRNRPLDVHGKEAAVVELGSVVTHQADFSPVNATARKLELKVVLDPALGGNLQGRGAGLPGTVDV